MPASKRKIINDPIYGFITIDDPLLFAVIDHPWYQRLRRIYQMALAQMVYPGAVHSRLHHSLGAYHLICLAIHELRQKGIDISYEEEMGAKSAILLHDIGHGPFSHALEHVLVPGVHHETIGLQIMQKLDNELDGRLTTAIDIFTNKYPKQFLHQLISGQLDVDRMDYLTRDSFFTGVSEGVIGYDRILKMLAVHEGQLMVEEKATYSVEKFLVARRQMYWQVYLHKTVLAAEKMVVKIIERAREIFDGSLKLNATLDYFFETFSEMNDEALEKFCLTDDHDVMFAIKKWSSHPDKVLSTLCKNLLNRRLYKCRLQTRAFDENEIEEKRKQTAAKMNISVHEAGYFVFTGEAMNTTYRLQDEQINIISKNGTVKDISQVDDPLIHKTLSMPVKKFYICQLI
ncbi:HD domain-containing protein [Parafilimonas sp.]|uniref:HD domain-containing protein n=1 Tax=Parafilimonas sp. TaxID=1969739 RepID=UPI0039E5F5D3